MRMKYWLYKSGYADFPADGYDQATKTIEVDLPEYRKPRFPSDWKLSGNSYYVPGKKCRVVFWNKGYAENFLVEWRGESKSFPASLYAREKVMEFVASL